MTVSKPNKQITESVYTIIILWSKNENTLLENQTGFSLESNVLIKYDYLVDKKHQRIKYICKNHNNKKLKACVHNYYVVIHLRKYIIRKSNLF